MQFCPKCGFGIDQEAFCPKCGQRQIPLSEYSGAAGKQEDSLVEPDAPSYDRLAPVRRDPGQSSKGMRPKDKKRLFGLSSKRHKAQVEQESFDDVGPTARNDRRFLERAKQIKATAQQTEEETEAFKENDIQEHRGFAVLSYCCFLVFVPLFVCKDSDYVRYHARQGLNVFAATVVAFLGKSMAIELVEMLQWPSFLTGILSVIVSLPFYAAYIALAALSVLGVSYAVRGKAKELPYLGKFNLLGSTDKEDE